MLELTIPSMTCGHCVSVVIKAIQQADPLAKVDIDLASHRVRIETAADGAIMQSAVAEAGYPPS